MSSVPELPPGLRAFCLIGKHDSSFLPITVDENGQLYIVVQGVAAVQIPGGVEVTQADDAREVQGSDGETRRTLAVDTAGRLIMVPRGQSGYYMLVDEHGYLSAQVRGYGPVRTLGENLVQNGSFEEAGGGGGDVWAYWVEYIPSGSIDDETGMVREGSHSARITSSSEGNMYIYQNIAVVSKRLAVVSFYTAGDGTTAGRWGLYDNTHSTYIYSYSSTYVTDKAFSRVEFAFSVPEGCTEVQLLLRTPPVEGAVAYYDSVSLRYVVEKSAGEGETIPVALDVDGHMLAMFKGRTGYYADVDENGYLTTVMKGDAGEGSLATVATDADGQIIAVFKGQSGYYADVDENGFLSVILKALYGSTPTGVACDADGRLKFFLTDNIDQWGEYLEVGNAELAARQYKFPVSYDRRGQVYFWDDFRDGQGAWNLTGAGGGTAAIVEADALQGGKCVELAVAAADGDTATMSLSPPLPADGERVGVALYFAFSNLPEYWRLRFRYFDGTTSHTCYLKGVSSDGKLYLYNDLAGETEVGSWSTTITGTNVWHYVKLVANLDTGAYIRVLYDGKEIDVSGVDYRQAVSAFRYMDLSFYVNGRAANAATFLVDCVTVTMKDI
jgi:hypothetical protein